MAEQAQSLANELTNDGLTDHESARFAILIEKLKPETLKQADKVLRTRGPGLRPNNHHGHDQADHDAHADGHDAHGPKFFESLLIAWEAPEALAELQKFNFDLKSRASRLEKLITPEQPKSEFEKSITPERSKIEIEKYETPEQQIAKLAKLQKAIAEAKPSLKDSSQLVGALVETSKEATPHRLAPLLEQCVSASFGFWATLLLLGAARRKERFMKEDQSDH